jgi:glycosyltransferase involved in cell wall biosynthesis
MKIGLVIYGSLDTLSGGYLYDRMLVEYLRANGDSVEIFSLPWRNYAAHLFDNIHFRLPGKLDVIIQDELNQPSLIQANSRKHPYPVVSLVHHLRCSEVRPRWQNAIFRSVERQYLRSVDGYILNSRTTWATVQALNSECKPHVIAFPAGDRLGTITQPQIVSRSLQNGPLRLLFVGTVIPRKGLHLLIDAISLLPDSSVTLDVAGGLTADTRYVESIYHQISKRGIGRLVTFHGAYTDATLKRLFSQSHLLVLPSYYEGFGIAYLESMAFGLPSIATKSGGAVEIVEDGVTGFLIPAGNTLALRERIMDLMSSKEKLMQMSLGAKRKFNEFPTWVESFSQVSHFLQQLLVERSI